MIRTTIEDAETQLRELIEAALRGEDVQITSTSERDDRVIKLVVVPSQDRPRYRKAGSAKGQIWMSDDFDEPLEDFKEYME
jgi:antitoxin (DNA-binding transcriptional repressor) of toxin-antitoxin stability system